MTGALDHVGGTGGTLSAFWHDCSRLGTERDSSEWGRRHCPLRGSEDPAGRKKLKRRVARDDSSVDSGGDHSDVQPDEGKQLVQYQPGAAAKPPFMDRLLQRMGGFEADSTPARAHPEHLAEVADYLPASSHPHSCSMHYAAITL